MDLDAQRRAAADLRRPRATSPTTRSSPGRARATASSASTASWRASSARWATSARRSPRSYGGRGLDYVTYGLIVEQVGRGDSLRAHRRLGPDLARLRLDRALGHRGAEAALAAAALLRRGARLLRPDRARHRLRRRRRCGPAPRRSTAAGGSTARRCGSRSATTPRSRWSSPRPTPRSSHRGLACFLVPTDSRRLLDPQEIHGKLGLRASDTAAIALDGVEVGDDALLGEVGEGFKVAMSRARLGPLLGRRRLRRDLRGLRRRLGRLRDRAQAVRRADRPLPARPGDDRRHDRQAATPRGCSSAAPACSRTPASRARSRPRSRSSTRPRRRSSAPTPRSRSTAAPATSTTTRSSATCATPA